MCQKVCQFFKIHKHDKLQNIKLKKKNIWKNYLKILFMGNTRCKTNNFFKYCNHILSFPFIMYKNGTPGDKEMSFSSIFGPRRFLESHQPFNPEMFAEMLLLRKEAMNQLCTEMLPSFLGCISSGRWMQTQSTCVCWNQFI